MLVGIMHQIIGVTDGANHICAGGEHGGSELGHIVGRNVAGEWHIVMPIKPANQPILHRDLLCDGAPPPPPPQELTAGGHEKSNQHPDPLYGRENRL